MQFRLERNVRHHLQIFGSSNNKRPVWIAAGERHGRIIGPDLSHVQDACIDDGLGRVLAAHRRNNAIDLGHARRKRHALLLRGWAALIGRIARVDHLSELRRGVGFCCVSRCGRSEREYDRKSDDTNLCVHPDLPCGA
jgi:hypothetical protein